MPLLGAPHGHELCYLFLMDALDMNCPVYDGNYRHVADLMGEMWTNFAKKGYIFLIDKTLHEIFSRWPLQRPITSGPHLA